MHLYKENKKNIDTIFLAFLFTRIVFVLMLIIGYYILPKGNDYYPNIKWVGDIVFQFNDAAIYPNIAENGYGTPNSLFAFAPLYPIIIKAFALIFFGNYSLAALVVSNICFIISILLLYKLLLNFLDKKTSMYSVLALVVFPTSHYNSIGYTEPLFLMITLISMTEYKDKNYLTSALFCGLAILTRITGIALLAGFGLDMLINFLIKKDFSIKSIRSLLKLGLSFLAVTMSIYGLWIMFMWTRTGDGLYFLQAQKNWGRTEPNFFIIPFVIELFIRVFKYPSLRSALEFLIPTIMLIFTIRVYKKVPVYFWFYSIMVIIMPLTTGSTFSLTRLPMLALASYVFIGIHAAKSKKFRIIWFFASFVFYVIFTATMGQLRGTFI